MSIGSIILVFALALSAAGGGVVYAARDTLPGDTLYPVKLSTEQVMMLLPGDDVMKMERALTFVERRIREMETLVERERLQNLEQAVEEYEHVLERALAWMEQACSGEQVAENVTAQVAEATATHLYVLDKLYDRVPETARAAIAHAREMSENGQQKALLDLAWHNRVRAVEMNLAALEGKLNRIQLRVKASSVNVQELKDALGEFEDTATFARVIYPIAEEEGLNLTAVAGLVTQATSTHLKILAELYDTVPEEAKEAVQNAMEQSFRGYEMVSKLMAQSETWSEFPGIPTSIRKRMEDILGWTDAPKARMPTGGSSGRGCFGCRR